MCRMLIYKGDPVTVSQLTHQPEHSLMKQSKDGGFPGCDTFRNVRVNGDGFGIAWYNPARLSIGACVFKCITPAWNNHNLKNIVQHMESFLIFGHIRAVHRSFTFFDHRNEISEDNCHPFVYGRYTFMHNGGISGFAKLKRSIRESLPDHLYHEIKGTTDSEHLFVMLLQEIGDLDRELTLVEIGNAVENTINRVTRMALAHNVHIGSSMNIIFSDGRHVIATRCRTALGEEQPSLFYCQGSGCYNDDPSVSNAICISSEPLTKSQKWAMLPKDHMISIPYSPENPALVGDVTIRRLVIDQIVPVVPSPPPAAAVRPPAPVVPVTAAPVTDAVVVAVVDEPVAVLKKVDSIEGATLPPPAAQLVSDSSCSPSEVPSGEDAEIHHVVSA